MILTLLAIQVLAVNLGIFSRNFDGTLGGIRDRKLGYPGIIITFRRNGEALQLQVVTVLYI